MSESDTSPGQTEQFGEFSSDELTWILLACDQCGVKDTQSARIKAAALKVLADMIDERNTVQ